MESVSEAIEQFNELLDMDGEIEVGGVSFLPSQILRELDPIAFREGLLNYVDDEGVNFDDLEDDEDF